MYTHVSLCRSLFISLLKRLTLRNWLNGLASPKSDGIGQQVRDSEELKFKTKGSLMAKCLIVSAGLPLFHKAFN